MRKNKKLWQSSALQLHIILTYLRAAGVCKHKPNPLLQHDRPYIDLRVGA